MRGKRGIIALILVLILAAGGYAGIIYYQNTYLTVNETVYRRDVTELDLSGAAELDLDRIAELKALKRLDLRDTGLTIAEYEQLREALPECEILWQLPFQGNYLELNTEELEITSLTQQELEDLRYLEQLQTVHAEACTDLDILMALQAEYPGWDVSYYVPLGDRLLAGTTANIVVKDADVEEMMEMLRYLPALRQVTLTGTMPDNEAVYELTVNYPDVRFIWNVELLGESYLSTSEEIDLSGVQMGSVETVENSLKYFISLKRVIMCDCGIPSEEMDALWKRHPEIRFVWSVPIQFFTVRTDATTLMPYQYGCNYLSNRDAKELKYLVDMVCIDFGHMGINDLSFLNYMPDLEYLIIADCGVKDLTPLSNLKKLKYLEVFQNDVKDLSPLAGCTSLRDLNVCYNSIRDFSPLVGLENIEHLWVSGNYVTNEQREMLDAAFPDAKIVYRTYSSTGKGWRQIPGYYEQRDLLGMWYTYEY